MDPTIIIALLSTIVPLVNNGLTFITAAKKAFDEGSEWTEQQRNDFLAMLDQLEKRPEVWQQVQPL